MTSYTAITDPDVDPESPGNTTLFTRLRDNPLAIAEGDATAPTVDKAIGANWVKLATATASSSATVEITSGIDASYDEYIIRITGVRPATDNNSLQAQVSTDGGSTWLSSNIYSIGDGAGTLVGQMDFVQGGGIGNASSDGYSGFITLSRFADAAEWKRVIADGIAIRNTAGTMYVDEERCAWGVQTTSALDAIRFFMASGNVDSGEFTLYGVRAL